jgi:hypothetical protein
MQTTTQPVADARSQVHRIADYWTTHGELPDDVSWDTVTEHAHTLHDAIEEQIQTHATGTELTRLEAEVWRLAKLMAQEPGVVITDGIALVLAVDDGPFHTAAVESEAITPREVDKLLARVEENVAAAQRLAMLAADPEFEDNIDNPEVVVLDRWTRQRLEDLAEPGEQTIEAVVRRHCDAVETRRELGAFCEEFLDEVGRENVVQITVAEQVSEGAVLLLTVHGNASLEDVDVVAETDAITIADRRFDVHVEVDPYGPSSLNCTTIYGTDPPENGQPDDSQSEVALADGVDAVTDAVAARINDEDARTPGTTLD